MSNRILLDDLPKWARKDLSGCTECRKYDSSVFLCGWHENFVVAFMVVEATAGTIVEDTDV